MDFLLFAVALTLVIAAGAGASLLLLHHRRVSRLELLSLSVPLGAAIISLGSFWLGALGLRGAMLRAMVSAIACGLAVAGWRRSVPRDGSSAVPGLHPGNPLLWLLILIQTSFIVWVALRLQLAHDGLIVWEAKAQLIFAGGGAMPIAQYRDPVTFVHPTYPLLLPHIEAWFYGWLGRADQGYLKLVLPLFYFAAAGLLAVGAGKRERAVIAVALLFFVPVITIGATSGEADFPLGVFYLASLVYLIELYRTNEMRLARVTGVCGAALPWVKAEGAILWLILIALAAIPLWRARRWRALAWAIAPGALVWALWRIYLAAVGAKGTYVFLPVTPGTLIANLGRLPEIARMTIAEIMKTEDWSLLWLGPALAVLAMILRSGSRRAAGMLLAATLVPVAAYMFIYLFSAWTPYTLHVETSLSRLLTQVAPSLILLIATAGAEREAQ